MRIAGGRSKALLGAGVAGILILVIIATANWAMTGNADGPAAQTPADAQTVESAPPADAPPSPSEPSPAAPPSIQPEDETSRAMVEPFHTGLLPAPLPDVRGNADAAAATLAAFIAARDEQSIPALLTAITTAGFAVRHEDGRIAQTVTPGQGLVFDAWEVAAMAKMYRERRTMPLSRLSEDLSLIPGLAGVPLGTLLVDGIKQHANGSQPELRFWARLIVELGHSADRPYDLLALTDPAAVQLDPVQAALILRRLFGDFAAAGQAGTRAASVEMPDVVLASLAQAQDPCSAMGQGEIATILDIAAIATGTGWGVVLDAVSQVTGDAADRYSNFLGIANTLLAYAKLIATYASIETEISMENPPLVRTTNATAGQRRQLTATVTMDSGGSDKYNCVRTALNVATGLDFDLIGDGPLTGVELTWRVDNPGADFYSNSTGITGNRPVVGITTGGPRIQDAGTYAGVGGAGTAVGDPTRSTTDDKGQARIFLEGTPRVPYLPPPHMPVMKEAVVRTNLRLKGGDITGDAVDLAGQVLGGVGGLITMPTELLYRVPWATVGHGVVRIRDWETCTSNEWYGSMTSTTRYVRNDVETFEGGDAVNTHESRYSHDATVNVAGDQATAVITSEELVASDNNSGYGRVTSRRMADGRYSGDVNVSISASPQLGTYSVGFERPSLTGTSRRSGTCERPSPYKCQPPTPSSQPWDGDNRYLSSLSGNIDPNDPTVIKDSQTMRRGDLEHTFSVNLQRCR